MWAGDRASHACHKVDAIAPGMATLSMAVREDMLNSHAICHGGYILPWPIPPSPTPATARTTTRWPPVHASIPGPGSWRPSERFSPAGGAGQSHRRLRRGIKQTGWSADSLFRGNSHRVGGALVEAETGEPLDE